MASKLKLKGAGDQRFYQLLEDIADLHSRKSLNYANDQDPLSNLKASEAFGISAWIGTLIRITDKYGRLVELAKGKPDLVGESIKDTLLDMAVYSLLAIILFEEENARRVRTNTTS